MIGFFLFFLYQKKDYGLEPNLPGYYYCTSSLQSSAAPVAWLVDFKQWAAHGKKVLTWTSENYSQPYNAITKGWKQWLAFFSVFCSLATCCFERLPECKTVAHRWLESCLGWCASAITARCCPSRVSSINSNHQNTRKSWLQLLSLFSLFQVFSSHDNEGSEQPATRRTSKHSH